MSNKNMKTFLDAAQRTIIGECVGESSDSITICNPVVVNITPQLDPTGRPMGGVALQLISVYFRELLGVKKNPMFFEYKKSQITPIDFEGGFDFRVYSQYEQIFNTQENIQSNTEKTESNSPPVLKLFEDK